MPPYSRCYGVTRGLQRSRGKRKETDSDRLFRLISENKGLSVEEISEKLGWTSSKTNRMLGVLDRKGRIAKRVFPVAQPRIVAKPLSHIGVLLVLATMVAGIGLNALWYSQISQPISTISLPSVRSATTSVFTSTDSFGWRRYAEIAWRYYSPGVGVNPTTGIHRAKLDWDAITDWNTASYIIATIEAHRLGLIESNGTWGFKDRIGKILRYLLTRELTVNLGVGNWPYWAYYWDGRPYYNPVYLYTDVSDSGRLLYALDILRNHDPGFTEQVQQVYQRCKTAYDAMSTIIDRHANYYGVLEAVGFSAFGYDKSKITNVFENWQGQFKNVEGQMLPQTGTVTEPTLHGVLELGLGGKFFEYTRRIYEAQKARWERTGQLSGWSEGCHPVHEFVYECILMENGEKWIIAKHDGTRVNIDPLMYTKVAFAYLAIFGENPYTTSLFNAASKLSHIRYGFGEATFENGESAISLWGSNLEGFYADSTNQIILAAARYALKGSA